MRLRILRGSRHFRRGTTTTARITTARRSRWTSKRVLITAGAGGIGLGIARACLAGGALVHIADVDADGVAGAIEANPG